MPNENAYKIPRKVPRGMHTLPPARWRLIVIVTDTPDPGEAYLTKEEITAEVLKALDLPAGIEFDIGTIEKAAQGST